jgi:hypothetical protein
MSRRYRFALAAVCLFAVSSAHAGLFAGFHKEQEFRPATQAELAMKSVEGDAGAEAAILDWVRVDNDQSSTSSEYFRIKILTEEGKKQAEIELPYSPGYPLYTRITDISARTIRPDGTIVPFDGKIYDKVLYKVGRRALRAKTFTFADVQPGSIIEYRYVRRWVEHLLLNTHWSVQRDIPVVRAKFILKPYQTDEFTSFFTYLGLPAGKAPVKVGNDRFELELTNMPAMREEMFAPPEEQLLARVNFFYTDHKVAPEKFWEMQSKVFATDIEKFIGKGGKNTATQLSQGVTDRTELLKKIYAHVQSLRNLSFESEKTEQEMKKQDIKLARNAEDVLKKGSGFRDELNRAFVAVARQAGFDADAMRVAPRDQFFFVEKFPDAEQMSGEIAVVNLDGKTIYLDPGTPRAPFGVVSWEKTNVPSIKVLKGAKPEWTRVPAQAPDDAFTRRTANLKLNDETLEGTISVTFQGQEALVRRLANITEDEAARKKAIEDEVKKWFPDGATLKLTGLTGLDTADPAITATFDVTLPNLVARAGSRTVVPVSIFASQTKNPFAPATRKFPIYYPYPSSEEDEVKITLPENVAVTLPTGSHLEGGILDYKSEAKRAGNVVTFTRAAKVATLMVDPKNYPQLRNFYSAMVTADQESLVLTPGGAK